MDTIFDLRFLNSLSTLIKFLGSEFGDKSNKTMLNSPSSLTLTNKFSSNSF